MLLLALLALGLTLTSCGNKTSKADQQGIEYTAAYVCPMHCDGSGSDNAGTCPVCGMDYVQNENSPHACPMHPEITGVAGDKCSKCSMALKPISVDDHKGHNH